MKKKTLKYTAIATGLVLLMGIVAATTVFWGINTDTARNLILAQVNRHIPGTVSVKRMRVSFFRGVIALTGIGLTDPGQHRVAAIRGLRIQWAWRPLLEKTFLIEHIRIQAPEVKLNIGPDGRLNIENVFSQRGPGTSEPPGAVPGVPVNVAVKDLQITDGSLQFKDEAKHLAIDALAINAKGGGNLAAGHARLALRIGGATVKSPAVKDRFKALEIAATLADGRIGNLQVSAAAPFGKMKIKGAIDALFSRPRVDLDLDMGISLSELSRTLALKRPLSGQVAAHLTIKGAPDDPEAHLALSVDRGRVFGVRLDSLSFSAGMLHRMVTLDAATAAIASGSVEATGRLDLAGIFPHGFFAPAKSIDAIAYQLDLRPEDIHLDQLVSGPSAPRGIVSGQLTLAGNGLSADALSAQAALTLSGRHMGGVSGVAPVDLKAKVNATMARGKITIKQLAARILDLRLAAAGHVDLESKALSGRLSLKAPNLAPPLRAIGIPGVAGKLGISGSFGGSLYRPVFDLKIDGTRLKARRVTIGSVQLAAALDPEGDLNISRLTLKNQGSLVTAAGRVRLFSAPHVLDSDPPVNFQATVKGFQAKDFVDQKIVSGTLDAVLKIHGKAKAPQAQLSLTGENLAGAGFHLGNISARLHLARGKLTAQEIMIVNQKSRIELTAAAQVLKPESLTLSPDPLFHASLNGDSVLIQDFFAPIKGVLTLKGHVEGRVSHPRGWLRVRGKHLEIASQPIKRLEIQAKVEDRRVAIDNLAASFGPQDKVTATGWLDLDREFELRLKSDGISLAAIHALKPYPDIGGRLALDVSAKGRLDNPSGSADIWLKNPQVNGHRLKDGRFHLTLAHGRAQFSGQMDFGVTGDYNLKNRDFHARLSLDGTRLTPYFLIAGQKQLDGVATGDFQAAGNLDRLADVEASANVLSMALTLNGRQLLQTRGLRANLAHEALVLEPVNFKILDKGVLSLAGRVGLQGPLDLTARGQIPVAVAKTFTDRVPDMYGTLTLSARLVGTRKQPNLSADIGLEDIGFTVPGLAQKLAGLNGTLHITPEAVLVKNISGHLGSGHFEFGGRLGLARMKPGAVNLHFKATALPVIVPGTLNATFNSDLTLTGTPEKTTLHGDAVLVDGTYTKDINLSLLQAVGHRTRAVAVAPKPITLPYLKNLNLNVFVKRRSPLIVDNNVAQLEISPDLRLSGTLNQPVILGRATIDQGTVTYRGKTFTVTKGAIDFLDPYRIEPTLNISSQAQIRTWTITLNISGPPDNLRFTLSANPPLQDADILSLILVGRTTQELIASQGGTSQSASQMLAQFLASTFANDIKSTTGLDIFKAEAGGGNTANSLKVTVGKNLSKRLTLKYQVDTQAGSMTQKAIAEYKLLEHILLSGFQNNNGVFGGELQLQYEFR